MNQLLHEQLKMYEKGVMSRSISRRRKHSVYMCSLIKHPKEILTLSEFDEKCFNKGYSRLIRGDM